MNKRLLDALISVSATSTSAREIAQKVLQENDTELVRKLYEKIDSLERQLGDLTSVVTLDEEVSDQEAATLIRNFNIRLKDVEWNVLKGYNRVNLSMYPKNIRVLIATVLCNKAKELKQTPMDEWLDIIALGGDIK